MFDKITLKNYRTHKHTTLDLQPVTLLIGNNNSGKTNLLAGIQHFSWLIRRGNPARSNPQKYDRTVQSRDYFRHRYRLAQDDESMSIHIEWHQGKKEVSYEMELYKNESFSPNNTGCREKLTVVCDDILSLSTEFTSGYDQATNQINLRSIIENSAEHLEQKRVCNAFFRDFANTFSYHFQPSFLKGVTALNQPNEDTEEEENSSQNDMSQRVRILSELGYEGRNFQTILNRVKEREERTFSRFVALMRRFETSFQGIQYSPKDSRLLWEFDLGRKTTDRLLDEFSAELVSDGFMKAAAISLLVSLQRPPALLLLEEIENGINPGNIQELMNWIWQATAPNQDNYSPQFILTSHSPSVLREFYNHLDSVYTVRLNKRNFQSDVRNLNTSLDTLVGIGTVEGDIIEDEQTGKRRVEIPKFQLAELWYSGTIG